MNPYELQIRLMGAPANSLLGYAEKSQCGTCELGLPSGAAKPATPVGAAASWSWSGEEARYAWYDRLVFWLKGWTKARRNFPSPAECIRCTDGTGDKELA
jgi:hypothetical protein